MFSQSVLGTTLDAPLVDRNSASFCAVVTQPIYTFGRISNGIDAARELVHANEADLDRNKLNVKINVAEIYVCHVKKHGVPNQSEQADWIMTTPPHDRREKQFQ